MQLCSVCQQHEIKIIGPRCKQCLDVAYHIAANYGYQYVAEYEDAITEMKEWIDQMAAPKVYVKPYTDPGVSTTPGDYSYWIGKGTTTTAPSWTWQPYTSGANYLVTGTTI